jgi:hypothetical protein
VAAERLGAHRRRTTRIRKRVLATAAVVFALVWAVLFVQLVSGHDPALSKTSAGAKTSSATPSGSTGAAGSGLTGATGSGSTGATGSGSTGATGSGSTGATGSTGSSSTSGSTSPLTTSQS